MTNFRFEFRNIPVEPGWPRAAMPITLGDQAPQISPTFAQFARYLRLRRRRRELDIGQCVELISDHARDDLTQLGMLLANQLLELGALFRREIQARGDSK